jgi:hypothetical protein
MHEMQRRLCHFQDGSLPGSVLLYAKFHPIIYLKLRKINSRSVCNWGEDVLEAGLFYCNDVVY